MNLTKVISRIQKTICLSLFVCIIVSNSNAQTQPNLDKWHGDSVNVIHYDIHLDITKLSARAISGYTEITLTPQVESFNEFAIDLLKMTIDSIYINGSKHTNFSYNDSIIHVNLASDLQKGEEIKMKVFYNGNPKKDPAWGGFFMSSNYAYNIGVGMGSDPVCFARTWFPCVDDFKDRALYDYHITITDEMEVVCGGVKIDEVDHADNTKTAHWKSNQSYPTYLASVAIGDYAVISDAYNGIEREIPILNYAYHEDSSGVISSLRDLKQVMTVFEELFGPYPFDRIGYATVPFDGGAMEHAMNIAVPPSYLNGSLDVEETIYHELSHMWFGDWVTCKEANEMWINEGWASYCEGIFLEHIYGEKRFKNYVRTYQREVLQSVHIRDGGFYAVADVPLDQTYGRTSYAKGASRVHTIRGYLGDEVFFNCVKEYLIQFGDSCASSEDLRDVFSEASGIDMTDFFDGWIFSPGFPHFAVDAYSVSPFGEGFSVSLDMRQRLRAQENFVNSNRVEVTFMDANWNMETHLVEFDGEKETVNVETNINPVSVYVDYNEKLSDAISNNVQVINEDKTYSFSNTNLTVYVDEFADSALISSEFNWVKPDKSGEQENGLIISEYFYWKISGLFPGNFKARGKFFFNTNSFSDGASSYKFDTLRLAYRKDANDLWHYVPQTFGGTPIIGEVTVSDLQPGEYALANNLWAINVLENSFDSGDNLRVYPNPAKDKINIEIDNEIINASIRIFSTDGKLMYSKSNLNSEMISWQPCKQNDSIYFVQLLSGEKILNTQKVLFSN
jgi:aminopeptidase N